MRAPLKSRLDSGRVTLILGGLVLLINAPLLGGAAGPGEASWLILDRTAVGQGEVWRLLTGHLLHYTPRHLGWDLLAFLLLGGWCEATGLLDQSATYAEPQYEPEIQPTIDYIRFACLNNPGEQAATPTPRP